MIWMRERERERERKDEGEWWGKTNFEREREREGNFKIVYTKKTHIQKVHTHGICCCSVIICIVL